jgi:hypothetical protein
MRRAAMSRPETSCSPGQPAACGLEPPPVLVAVVAQQALVGPAFGVGELLVALAHLEQGLRRRRAIAGVMLEMR